MKKNELQHKSYFIIAFFLGTLFVFAQHGSIKGNIIDGDTQEALPTASILVKTGNSVKGTASDLNGNFSITNLNPGNYMVEISFIGYQTKVIPKVKVKAGAIAPLPDIVLNLSSEDLPPVELITKTNILEYGDDSAVNLAAKEIANLPIQRNFGSIVKTMSTDAKVSEDGTEIQFRGARASATAMMIDGVKTFGTNSNLPGVAIGNFRIFSGGVPAEYGDFTGGIIVVESKDYFSMYEQYLAQKKYEEALKEYKEN